MKIAVLGTGVVRRTVADRLATLGPDVVIGTRNVDATLGRAEPDAMGNPSFAQWHADHRQIGMVDFAHGMPPVLSVSNTDTPVRRQPRRIGGLSSVVVPRV